MSQSQAAPPPTDQLRQTGSMPAFATFIDEYALPGHDALNAALLAEIARWRAAEEGLTLTNHLGWHSPRTLFSREEPALRLLARHIRTALAHSTKRYWAEFDPTSHPVVCEGWVNVNATGAFNRPHDHAGSHLSGSYYVSVPPASEEASGAIEFLNPVGVGWLKLPNGASLTPPSLCVTPKAGQMFVFPSHLRHWVFPNQEEEDRVSVAFNFRVA